MGTVAKVALGVVLGLTVLIVGCAAIIGIDAGLNPSGGEDTGLEDTSTDPGGFSDEPSRSPQRTRRFSGNGTKNVGTIKVTDDAVLSWRTSGDGYGNRLFSVSDKEFKINVSSEAAKGRSSLEPGTYRRVDVTSFGDWTMTIKGR